MLTSNHPLWIPKLSDIDVTEMESELRCAERSNSVLRQSGALLLRRWLDDAGAQGIDVATLRHAALAVGVSQRIRLPPQFSLQPPTETPTGDLSIFVAASIVNKNYRDSSEHPQVSDVPAILTQIATNGA